MPSQASQPSDVQAVPVRQLLPDYPCMAPLSAAHVAFFAKCAHPAGGQFNNAADSVFSRQILYYGVDALALAATAAFALGLIENGSEPSASPVFAKLFVERAKVPEILVHEVTQLLGLYVPPQSLQVDATQGLTFTKNLSRSVPVLRSDYNNPLNPFREREGPIPARLLQQTWNKFDFDDAARAAAILLVAKALWERTSGIYRQLEPQYTLKAVRPAIRELLACYDKLMESHCNATDIRRGSLRMGKDYIAQIRLQDSEVPEFDETARALQLAEFARAIPERREAALSLIRSIAGQRELAHARVARAILELEEVQTPAPGPGVEAVASEQASEPRPKSHLPEPARPQNAVSFHTSVAAQWQMLREATIAILSSDPEIRDAGARTLLSLRRGLASPLRDRLLTALRLWNRIVQDFQRLETLEEVIEAGIQRGEKDAIERGIADLTNAFDSAARPVKQAARRAVQLYKNYLSFLSPSTSLTVVQPEGPGDTSAYRAALLQAFQRGDMARVQCSNNASYLGQVVYGDLDLGSVVLLDHAREKSHRLPLASIAKLEILAIRPSTSTK